MKDVMVDLETLGTRPGCSILSIGAVAFDVVSGQIGPEFYTVVDRKSCSSAGLSEEPDTLSWWGMQSPEARKVLEDAEHGEPLSASLSRLTEYLGQFTRDEVRVWGNGADFDNAILSFCYGESGTPWRFWNNRCYRTLKSVVPGPRLRRTGVHHNALDDAKTQAAHAIQLLGVLHGR